MVDDIDQEGANGAADDSAARRQIQDNLMKKYLALDDSAAHLQSALAKTANYELYDRLSLELADTQHERSLCKACYDALDAGRPFVQPDQAAEDALMSAIDAVDRAAANTAAVGALIDAADQLVNAYPAQATVAS